MKTAEMLRTYATRLLSITLLLVLYLAPLNIKADIRCNGPFCADIIGFDDVTLTLEDSSGTTPVIYGEDEYCILSFIRLGPFRRRTNFDVLPGGSTSGNNFILSLNDASIPVTVKWRGGAPVNGVSTFEELRPGVLASDHQGARNCNDTPNSRAWVRFEVVPSDLNEKPPGNYEGTFSADVGLDGSSYHSRLSLDINIPELVKVSGLDDMQLTGRGNGRYRQDEEFCAFVTGGGSYRIRASGGPAINDPFLLSNGSETVPYQVRLSDNGTNLVAPVNPGQTITASNGSAFLNCENLTSRTNTRLRVIVLDSSLPDQPTGSYKGTLYLTIEPA